MSTLSGWKANLGFGARFPGSLPCGSGPVFCFHEVDDDVLEPTLDCGLIDGTSDILSQPREIEPLSELQRL